MHTSLVTVVDQWSSYILHQFCFHDKNRCSQTSHLLTCHNIFSSQTYPMHHPLTIHTEFWEAYQSVICVLALRRPTLHLELFKFAHFVQAPEITLRTWQRFSPIVTTLCLTHSPIDYLRDPHWLTPAYSSAWNHTTYPTHTVLWALLHALC